MRAKTLTVEEIKAIIAEHYVVALKYVRVNDTFHIAEAGQWHSPDHDKMIVEGETPLSAAFADLTRDWVEVKGRSMTLKMGSLPDDEQKLAELFGVKAGRP